MTSTIIASSLPVDPAAWHAALARADSLFLPLRPGSRIGLVPEEAVLPDGPEGIAMLVWERCADGLCVASEPFGSFETVAADVLIAVDEHGREAIGRALEGDLVAAIRTLLRAGHLLFFARRPRAELEEAGYEELLEALGFAFLGACR